MEEGLNSGSVEKHGLDLNRDPSEQMESNLTVIDLVSRQDLDLNESIGEVCENDGEAKGVIADVDDSVKVEVGVGEVGEELQPKGLEANQVEVVVKKRRGRPKKVVDSTQLELEKKGLSSMSSELSPSAERSRGKGIDNGNDKKDQIEDNVAGEPHGKGDAMKGKGRRGRKKKELVASSPGGQTEKGSDDMVGLETNKIVEGTINAGTQVQVDESNVKGQDMPGRRGSGRKRPKVDYSELHEDDFTDEDDIVACPDQCEIKPRGRGRGRKRIKVDGSDCLDDDNQVKRQKVNTMGQFKRVLRSQTVAVIDGVKDEGVSSPKIENKIGSSDKLPKVRANDNATPKKRGRPRLKETKLKGRRGRPPKMKGRNEISSLTSRQKDKLRGPKRGMNYEKEDGSVRGSKHLKASPANAVEEVVKEMDFGHEKDTDQANAETNYEDPGDGQNKRLSSGTYHEKKTKLKGSKPEVMESGLREQKQAIRNQIIDMLVKAGWNIEYRPRLTRKYSDAIFYDPEGRQHWSVTLAYKKLKQKVEAGDADDKTISAFTPIPEEVFSTLFRVRKDKEKKGKKKIKDIGSKMRKKMIMKRLFKKRTAKNNLGRSDYKGSIGPKTGHNSNVAVRRKKLGPNTEDGQRRKPCALLARNSQGGSDSDGDEFILYDGKRTLLAWMIDLGVIQCDAQVHYIYGGRKKVKHAGKIKGDGICCGCCGETLKLADFESHAGSKLGRPFQNVILQSGQSLLQCLVDSWNKQKEIDRIAFHSVDIIGDDPNDDTCNICGDGGDLICCDSCPSTFHQSCLDIQVRHIFFYPFISLFPFLCIVLVLLQSMLKEYDSILFTSVNPEKSTMLSFFINTLGHICRITLLIGFLV